MSGSFLVWTRYMYDLLFVWLHPFRLMAFAFIASVFIKQNHVSFVLITITIDAFANFFHAKLEKFFVMIYLQALHLNVGLHMGTSHLHSWKWTIWFIVYYSKYNFTCLYQCTSHFLYFQNISQFEYMIFFHQLFHKWDMLELNVRYFFRINYTDANWHLSGSLSTIISVKLYFLFVTCWIMMIV